MTVNYRFIGKGTTDANGVAHLTEDAEGNTVSPPGYVGVGAGLIDVVASIDNPITSGSVVSHTYEVLDCIFEDNNNSRELSDYTQSGVWTDVSFTKVDDYKFIEKTSTVANVGRILVDNLLTEDFEIAFELKTTDYVNITLQNQKVNPTKSTYYTIYGYQPQYMGANWAYYKLKRVGSIFTMQGSTDQINWEDLTIGGNTLGTDGGYLLLSFGYSTRSPQSISFRNLKIYPI